MKKESLIEQLNGDAAYQSALKSARSDEERRLIKATTESFLRTMENLFTQFNEVQKNPELMSQVLDQMRQTSQGQDYLTEREPPEKKDGQ